MERERERKRKKKMRDTAEKEKERESRERNGKRKQRERKKSKGEKERKGEKTEREKEKKEETHISHCAEHTSQGNVHNRGNTRIPSPPPFDLFLSPPHLCRFVLLPLTSCRWHASSGMPL